MATKISYDEYREAVNDYLGWCSACNEFTRETCEPDATEYDCPDCGQNTVYGAEVALIMGLFIF